MASFIPQEYLLGTGVNERLCECRNTKADIPILVESRLAYKRSEGDSDYTREEAVADVFDILDANSQWALVSDITSEEYDKLCAEGHL